MPTPSLKVDQVANAFVSIPGITVPMLDAAPGVTSTTSGTFVQMSGSTGTFVVPVTGTYLIQLMIDGFATSGTEEGRYRIAIDVAGTPIYVGSDNTGWGIATAASPPVRGYKTMVGSVELTAGSHTIEIQWRRVLGTGTWNSDAYTRAVVRGTLVSGSGAGGIIPTSAELSADASAVSSAHPTYADISGLSVSVTTSGNETVLVCISGWGLQGASLADVMIRLNVDGAAVPSGSADRLLGRTGTYAAPLGAPRAVALTGAGSHTIKVQAAYGTAQWTPKAGMRLDVFQFRGGLVPVEHDGVAAIDTPRSFNFIGPNVDIANVDGKANITFNGTTGAISSTANAATNPISVSNTSYTDVSGLSVTITTLAGESVQLNFQGNAYVAGAYNAYVQWVIDGVALDAPAASNGGTGIALDLSFSRNYTFATAGAHTLKIQAKYATNAFYLYDAKIGVLQFRGGYVQPENVPILEYSSASVVNVKAGPGASSELRVLLNDGQRYTYTGTLTFDITTSGLGGRDTGSESNGWWYIYGVPSATAGQLAVVGSISPPSTGPTGYAVWRYLGAVYNNTDIRKWYQIGSLFLLDAAGTIADYTSTWKVSPQSVDASAWAPATARSLLTEFSGAHSSGNGAAWFQIYTETATPSANPSTSDTAPIGFTWVDANNGYANTTNLTLSIPIGANRTFQYRSFNNTSSPYNNGSAVMGNQLLRTTGYVDGYLDGSRSSTAVMPLNVLVRSQGSTPRTILTSETGNLFTGTTTPITFNLPTAAVGLNYEFVLQNDDTMTIVPNGSDTIRIGTSETSGTDQISATDNGAAIRLVCIVAGKWHATSYIGTWTVSS